MNLKNYLEKIYNEAPFDIATPDPAGKQVVLYKGPMKDGIQIGAVKAEGNVSDKGGVKFISVNGLRPMLGVLMQKFGVTQEAINAFTNTYKQGIPFSNDVIELEVSKDAITLRPEAKNKAAGVA